MTLTLTKEFSNEIWSLIIENCDNLNSIKNLSITDKRIRDLALRALDKIKYNKDALYQALFEIQDTLYTTKYQRINGPSLDVTKLGKFVYIQAEVKKGLIYCKSLIVMDKELREPTKDQIIAVLDCGRPDIQQFANPDDYHYYFSYGAGYVTIDSLQDRLPIKKLTMRSNRSNPHLSIAMKLAENKLNNLFYKLNGSYLDALYRYANFFYLFKIPLIRNKQELA